MKKFTRILALLLATTLMLSGIAGCGSSNKPDPKNPVTITVWHYYNGSIMNAFEEMVKTFNETVGTKEGVIVEGFGHGNVGELESAVLASASGDIKSQDMPNIFASYADTAYEAEKLELLADLDKYFTKDEQKEYHPSYIEEGKIGMNGELRIFPIAKSTELMMINETDWAPFAADQNLTYDNLREMESLVEVARLYYEWTDAKTPDVPNDGKAFFGRDSLANMFIIGSKEFDTEIFSVSGGKATINLNRDVMRKIWDCFYVPYISGHFYSYGKFRSDDAKVGDLLAYVGSTTSASYFPREVTIEGNSHPIEAAVLPAPHFAGAKSVMVQQGAGMVVTKATPQEEYASVLFLKWFTEQSNNIRFAALSGYMPVKNDAIDYDTIKSEIEQAGIEFGQINDETLKVALDSISVSELYTSKAFSGGKQARNILEYNLEDKALADREAVVALIDGGSTHEQAVAQFNTEANFQSWLDTMTELLNNAAAE